MGAEGVQMGTRMLSSAESPVHGNWKQAMLAAKETDTVFLNQQSRPALRALRTRVTEELLPKGRVQCHGILRTRAGTLLWR